MRIHYTAGLLSFLIAACGTKDDGEDWDSSSHGDHDHSAHQGDTDLPDDFDPSTEQTSSTGVTVSYETDPSPIPESTEFTIIFTVSDGTLVEADATMPTHGGHGMPVAPALVDNGDGTYTAQPFEFAMPGYWVIHATVQDENGTAERVDFDVDCCE